VFTDCVFSSNEAGVSGVSGGYGGAVYCDSNSHPQFVNCSFFSNSSNSQGGAVCCISTGAEFTGCLFQGNGAGGPGGAGIYLERAAVEVVSCTFRDNNAGHASGGGILAVDADATISDCLFDTNDAERGAGIACKTGDVSTITRCTFSGNNGYYDWGGGGGMSCESASPLIDDCIFEGNDAGNGGAIWVYFPGADPEIRNCTMVRNTGPCASALAVTDEARATIRNCIIAYNEDAPAVKCFAEPPCWWTAGTIRVFCTDIFGNPDGDWTDCITLQQGLNDNLNANPAFCDMSGSDWHLASDSPCAPAQQPECGLIGAMDVGCGPTATHPATWGTVKQLFRH
jgi:predicted outer membrane repeat protein